MVSEKSTMMFSLDSFSKRRRGVGPRNFEFVLAIVGLARRSLGTLQSSANHKWLFWFQSTFGSDHKTGVVFVTQGRGRKSDRPTVGLHFCGRDPVPEDGFRSRATAYKGASHR